MIFTRYIGDESREFTPGKMYLASPELNGSETVNFGFCTVVSDTGKSIRINPSKKTFEFLNEVYAVVINPMTFTIINETTKAETGDVVVLDDATEDGKMMNLKGCGYHVSSNFIVLDRTNVFPGLIVLDKTTNKWVPVKRVDESLWMVVNGGKDMMSPQNFRFAVADGDILTDPIVRCVNATGYGNRLTLNRLYRLQSSWNNLCCVVGDDGKTVEAFEDRFRMGS